MKLQIWQYGNGNESKGKSKESNDEEKVEIMWI